MGGNLLVPFPFFVYDVQSEQKQHLTWLIAFALAVF